MAVFRFYARNEQTDESDVVVMLDFNGFVGLECIDMAIEIEDCLGNKTDVIKGKYLKPKFYERIEKNLIYV